MEVIYVAELKNGTVVGVSQLNREGFISHPNLIEIQSFNAALIGKKYIAELNQFTEPQEVGDKS